MVIIFRKWKLKRCDFLVTPKLYPESMAVVFCSQQQVQRIEGDLQADSKCKHDTDGVCDEMNF